MTVTLNNNGGSNVQLKSYTNDPQFRVTGGTCLSAPVVAAGASCAFMVTFTPTARGDATGTVTIASDVLAPLALAMAGTSPTTTTLVLGGKTFVIAYPTPISNFPDTDPATLPTDVTASLWNLTAATSAFGAGSGSPVALTSGQPLSEVQWPIRFDYWALQSGLTTTKGAGCQVDLVGSSLVLTANAVSTSVLLDGTSAVLNNLRQQIYPGDVLSYGASQRTVGTVSVVRSVQIDAFDGALLGNATAINLNAIFDSLGTGAYGTAAAVQQTSTTSQRYVCSDTP